MSFLSKNLLCQNIYTMSSFMWSNELFSILIGFQYIESDWLSNRILPNLFLQLSYPKLYFEDQILAIILQQFMILKISAL